MTTPRGGKPNWLPYAGLALTISGIIYQGGVLSSQVQNNKERIVKLEAVQAAQQVTLQDINTRGVQNAAKLDFLVEEAKEERRR